jgi:hypothetical protein
VAKPWRGNKHWNIWQDVPLAKCTGSKTAIPQTAMSGYRHTAKRKSNPPAKIAAEGVVPAPPQAQFAYALHLPPV